MNGCMILTPKPGQIDYTNAKTVPVVNCIVVHNNQILLVRRSKKLRFYPDYWHCIAGFMDDEKDALEKVKEELWEETGVENDSIVRIELVKKVEKYDTRHQRTWIIHFVFMEINTDTVRLNWEASEYQWVSRDEFARLEPMIPFFKSNALKVLSEQPIKTSSF